MLLRLCLLHLTLFVVRALAQNTGELGEMCEVQMGWMGECKLSYECKALAQLIPSGFTVSFCNMSGPVVCCPEGLPTPTTTVLQQHQQEQHMQQQQMQQHSIEPVISESQRAEVKRPYKRGTGYMKPHAHLYVKLTRPVDEDEVRPVVRRKPLIRRKPVRMVRRRKRRPHRPITNPNHHHNHQHNQNFPSGNKPSSYAAQYHYDRNRQSFRPTRTPGKRNEPLYSEEALVPDAFPESFADETMDYQAMLNYPLNSIKRRISEIKCEEYGNVATETVAELSKYGVVPVKIEKCSLTNINHNSDSTTEIAEFPHLAGLGYEEGEYTIWGCAGSLISDTFVLTAANCIDSVLGQPVKVKLGDVKLGGVSSSGLSSQEYKVIDVLIHPMYNSTTRQNNLALVKLHKRVRFSDEVRPACLHTLPTIRTRSLIATDWSLLESLTLEIKLSSNKTHRFTDGSEAVGLRKTSVNILENNDCLIPQEVADSLICAGILRSCSSEGAGALLQSRSDLNKCMYNVIGVATTQSCDETRPTVFTRISSYLTWIEHNVWP